MVAKKKLSIEERVKDLDVIIKEFEDGKLSIEESLEKYDSAKKLVDEIRKELESIELKINQME